MTTGLRVLFATYPEKTIFQYFAPLAWALRTAGHEVRVASSPGFTGVITQAGLTAVPVGADRDLWRMAEHRPAQREAVRAGVPKPFDAAADPAKVTWDYLKSGYRQQVEWWLRMKSVPMIAGLLEFARHWKPDLVIWEPTTYAGPIVAKAVGATHARLLYGSDIFGVTREHYLTLKNRQPPSDQADPLAEWLTAYAGMHGTGYTEDMACGQFTIEQFPPAFHLHAAGLDYVPMRYTPYGGPATVPEWLWETPKRPRVALTLGLSATERFDGYAVDLQDILNSVADLEIELVATLTGEHAARLRVPDNATIVPYAPLHHLVPTCAAVIHHAGAATMATTTLHGVPQLALPYHFDQPILGRQLAQHGAGLTIDPENVTGETVRHALLRLLNEPAFRERSRDLRDEMLATPTPNNLVPQLEELTEKHRSIRSL